MRTSRGVVGYVRAIAQIKCGQWCKVYARELFFLRNAFGHIKEIAIDKGGLELLNKASIESDKGVVNIDDIAGFIAAARTRQWKREPSVHGLA